MVNALIMWGVMLLVYRRRKFYGQVVVAFLIYYGVTRFLLEFFRGDADRGMWFGQTISTGQIAMIVSIIAGLVLWFFLRKRTRIKD